MRKQIIALGALVFLAACSDQSENIAKVDETTPSTTEPTTEPAPEVPTEPTTDSTTATTGDPESSASEPSTDTPPSSSSQPPPYSSSFTMPWFSSSSYPGDLPMLSSSSFAPPVPESSSTLDMPRGEIGTCAPLANPIKTGERVKWKFTIEKANVLYSVVDFVRAKFEWSFGEGTLHEGASANMVSGEVEYLTSGTHEASVTVIMPDEKLFLIECSPLQVYDQAVIDLHPAD